MTLRDTIRSILQYVLDWAKKNRDYFGSIKADYEKKLAEERRIAEFKKNYYAKVAAEEAKKRG